MTERPQFIDGLNAQFNQMTRWQHEEIGGFSPRTISPDLTVMETSFPGGWRYYAEHKGRLIAHLSVDHESGVHNADWVIDHSQEGPLFTAGMYLFVRKSIGFYLGFKSRGVRTDPASDDLSFPEITAKYRFLGERLAFDQIDLDFSGVQQRSLTTDEAVQVNTDYNEDSVILSSRLTSGAVEEIRLPESLDFKWLDTVNNMPAISDESLPYLQWPNIVGAQFSLRTPLDQIRLG